MQFLSITIKNLVLINIQNTKKRLKNSEVDGSAVSLHRLPQHVPSHLSRLCRGSSGGFQIIIIIVIVIVIVIVIIIVIVISSIIIIVVNAPSRFSQPPCCLTTPRVTLAAIRS